jgi:hypothetical protein
MIAWDVIVQTKIVEKSPLIRVLTTHHRSALQSLSTGKQNHAGRVASNTLSTLSTQSRRHGRS